MYSEVSISVILHVVKNYEVTLITMIIIIILIIVFLFFLFIHDILLVFWFLYEKCQLMHV